MVVIAAVIEIATGEAVATAIANVVVQDHHTTAHVETTTSKILTPPAANTVLVSARIATVETIDEAIETGTAIVAKEDAMMIEDHQDEATFSRIEGAAAVAAVVAVAMIEEVVTNSLNKLEEVAVHHPRSASLRLI